MKAAYKRDLQNNYLVLSVDREEGEDGYQLRMAENNDITGLLPFHSARTDGELQLYYEITSKQSISSLYEKRLMGWKDIIFVLEGLKEVLEGLQKYLLNPAQLVFYPEYIYTNADRRTVFLCYFPGAQAETSIVSLAEFILKRLDHEDRNAVELGYSFYQRISEENFSLYKTLRELLIEMKSLEHPADRCEMQRSDVKPGGENSTPGVYKEYDREERNTQKTLPERKADREERTEKGEAGIHADGAARYKEDEEYEVTHKERRGRHSCARDRADKIFRVVHPAVLLSGLLFFALLEVAYYFGAIGLTEAGGIFFLIVSAEMLLNKYLSDRSKKGRKAQWAEEEEDEMYRILQEEMYEEAPPEEKIEETQYLAVTPEERSLRLISVRPEGGAGRFPDICLNTATLYVGKIKGEADILLDSPTVSRVHARLEKKEGRYFVKDLNSKNGTFYNGKRLEPQEQCEIAVGDRIAFAEIEYQAVQL